MECADELRLPPIFESPIPIASISETRDSPADDPTVVQFKEEIAIEAAHQRSTWLQQRGDGDASSLTR